MQSRAISAAPEIANMILPERAASNFFIFSALNNPDKNYYLILKRPAV
jgi:hypothetical protein